MIKVCHSSVKFWFNSLNLCKLCTKLKGTLYTVNRKPTRIATLGFNVLIWVRTWIKTWLRTWVGTWIRTWIVVWSRTWIVILNWIRIWNKTWLRSWVGTWIRTWIVVWIRLFLEQSKNLTLIIWFSLLGESKHLKLIIDNNILIAPLNILIAQLCILIDLFHMITIQIYTFDTYHQ